MSEEPELIKAGSGLVKLGYRNKPVEVDCRVISEEMYQEMKMMMHRQPIDRRIFKSMVSKIIKRYSSNPIPQDEINSMEWIAAELYTEFNINSK